MKYVSLKSAASMPELFYAAERFLRKYEKKYCALMERVLNKESSVYLIFEYDFFRRKSALRGVFSFNRGRSFTSCIPHFTKGIERVLKNFFREHEVFSIIGEETGVKKIEQIIQDYKKVTPGECREMILMEGNTADETELSENLITSNVKIIECTKENEEQLFKLHLQFVENEVLPKWKELNLAAERMNIELIIKNQKIFAVQSDGILVSKAQTNAVTKNYIQIGGVFTEEEYRRKGYACLLLNRFRKYAVEQEKKVILYVRKNNPSAIHSYENAGFKNICSYRMVYYR